MLSKEEAKKLSVGYDIVPIYTEMLSDVTTPIMVLKKLKKKSKNCYILESVENGVEEEKHFGRYTFLGYEPTMELTCQNGKVTIKEGQGQDEQGNFHMVLKEERTDVHPGDCVRKILKKYRSPKVEGLPSFTGGFVGYFS